MAMTETEMRQRSSDGRGGAYVVKRNETKLSFLTTEFWAMVAAIAAILFAADRADNFEADRAWTLVAAVVVGYLLSRGLAKSGSSYRDREGLDDRN